MAIGVVFAVGLGAVLAAASNTWNWSSGAIFWAGMAMAAFLGFVVTPLVALPIRIRRDGGKLRIRGPSSRR
ncbi:MAG TPA: hypothetical protein VID51_02620 [Solirubrobacterales bacterium]|jgi:uncharacterized membrane protein